MPDFREERMKSRTFTAETDPAGRNRGEIPCPNLPVILLATRSLAPKTLETDPELRKLSRRFAILLVDSPDRALNLSCRLRSTGHRVVLLLSDMLNRGSEVIHFASAFSQDWPVADFHLFDAVEGRVIFTENHDPDVDRGPGIRIESNGREHLDVDLVLKTVERYYPQSSR